MDIAQALTMTGMIVVALLLYVMRSWHLDDPQLTHYELARQVRTKDSEMKRLIGYSEHVKELRFFRLVVTAVAMLGGFWCAIWLYPAWGVIWVIGGVAVIEIAAGWRISRRIAEWLYRQLESRLWSIARGFSRALRFLRHDTTISTAKRSFYSKEELRHILKTDSGVLTYDEKQMIAQALHYSQATIADIMTSRKVMETVSADNDVGPIELDRLHKLKLDKFPVIGRDENDIVGVLYLHYLPSSARHAKKISQLMQRDVYYVRSHWPLDELFAAILQTNSHFFIVIDDTNTIVGLVTLTDVLRYVLGRKLKATLPNYEDRDEIAAQ